MKASKGKLESLSHRITKFWLAEYCWENELDFATEVVFKDNQRADFIIKDWHLAIEVLGTEQVEDFIQKDYPIPVIPISALITPQELIKMLDDLACTNGREWDYYYKKNLTELNFMKSGIIKSIRDVT